MIEVKSVHRLDEIESVLRRVLQRHGAVLHSAIHLGHVFTEHERLAHRDAYVYTVCHSDLYALLLDADMRFSMFLPVRIAAWTRGGATTLQALSPLEASRILNRPDLERLVAQLDHFLGVVLDEASRPLTEGARASSSTGTGLGATEAQMSQRGSIPQRIDARGTKIEELAGTGSHDAAGG